MSGQGWLRFVHPSDSRNSKFNLGRRPGRIGDLFTLASFRVERSVKGRLWLRQRFPDEYHVEVHPHLAPCQRPTTTRVVVAPSVHGVRGQDDIVVHLDYPASWFSEHTPVDGLLGIRVILGFLEAIKGIGREFGMQGPQLKTPREDRRKTVDLDLFSQAASTGEVTMAFNSVKEN
jgi:hypothetical protein